MSPHSLCIPLLNFCLKLLCLLLYRNLSTYSLIFHNNQRLSTCLIVSLINFWLASACHDIRVPLKAADARARDTDTHQNISMHVSGTQSLEVVGGRTFI